jgi:16S rRNA (cytidine1402-2'-O)-methyltransferase
MPGTLYLVATPIGNLSDISLRAIKTLEAADIIACEDTRHTQKLLNHLGLKKKLISYHEHNEIARAEEFGGLLLGGKSIALVSDAGTPGICDPAYQIVKKAIEIGAAVNSIPGAAAFVSALICSGLPTDSFYFGGFLPSKKNGRRARYEEVRLLNATIIFYESPHRIAQSLLDCFEILGNRQMALARELTKMHEEIIRGELRDISARQLQLKGEIVLIIDREEISDPLSENSSINIADRMAELEREGLDRKQAMKKLAKESGINKSEIYRQIVSLKK